MIQGNFYERLHFYMDSCVISPTASLFLRNNNNPIIIQNQRCKVDKDYIGDDPVEPGATRLEEVSLVVVPANRQRVNNRQTSLQDGTCRWKGRIVKNFKKFRKVYFH